MAREATYYVGRRTVGVGGPRPTNLEVQAVDRAGLRPLGHHRRWSDAAFDWGVRSDGALELAYALLHDLTGLWPSAAACDELVSALLRDLPLDGFVLAEGELHDWVDERV